MSRKGNPTDYLYNLICTGLSWRLEGGFGRDGCQRGRISTDISGSTYPVSSGTSVKTVERESVFDVG